MNRQREHSMLLTMVVLSVVACAAGGRNAFANERPVADAGLPRYAAKDAVKLDGSQSHDPDQSGPLTYTWRQISGPSATVTGAETATPTIGGPFVQTQAIQECEFELVVSDGELTSAPDTVKVIIVPDFGPSTLRLVNPPFRHDRPTGFYFAGGDCVTGVSEPLIQGGPWVEWHKLANWIDFPRGYVPDTSGAESWRTYYHYGDMIIVYFSSVAPDYAGMIQIIGMSTGGQPAVDAAIRLNRYRDPRYAVNQVTELEAPCRWQSSWAAYLASNELLHGSAVDGEPLWHEHYWGETYRIANPPRDLVGIYLEGYDHFGVLSWYKNSLTNSAANQFNHGVAGGAFWSVLRPGRNLQPTADTVGHYFHWTREESMVMSNESTYPGRFPEPVTLAAWLDVSDGSVEGNGAVLSCQYSENAVSYKLLVGSDPHRVAQYQVISETPIPPQDVVTDLPSGEVWWTIRVRDQYGSTIYADPIRLDVASLQSPAVQNVRTGKRYGLIEHAFVETQAGDHILLGPGTYVETIEFGDKPLTISSLDPADPVVVAETIVTGQSGNPVVTYSGRQSADCILDGLTVQSDTVGISCRDAAPTIRNCVVDCPQGIALEYWAARAPTLIDCTISGQVKEGGDPGLFAYWTLNETEGTIAHDGVGENHGAVAGDAGWRPQGGQIAGALELDGIDDVVTADRILGLQQGSFSVFAWVKGGAPGQVVLSQDKGANWLMAAASTGGLTTELTSGRGGPLASVAVVTDGAWHRVGFVRDGVDRILYVDDVEVARDAVTSLMDATGALHIGAGKGLDAGTFWSGLIDDVRLYNQAVEP